jgi:RNA polymerase-binding transcription factor DksA
MATTSDSVISGDFARTELRARLERDRNELLAQLKAARSDHPSTTATTGQGETEHVSTGVENSVQAALEAGDSARLADVNDALQRIEDGTYGRCQRCGSTIPSARLEALPHARFCISCQSAEDALRRPRIPR